MPSLVGSEMCIRDSVMPHPPSRKGKLSPKYIHTHKQRPRSIRLSVSSMSRGLSIRLSKNTQKKTFCQSLGSCASPKHKWFPTRPLNVRHSDIGYPLSGLRFRFSLQKRQNCLILFILVPSYLGRGFASISGVLFRVKFLNLAFFSANRRDAAGRPNAAA